MNKLNSEQIKELCRIQHKMFISEYLISKMPIAYTNMDLGYFERDMRIRSTYEKCKDQMVELIEKYGNEVIENTFGDTEYMQNNRFTLEEQRQATKEVIGKELTLEEVFERY